ncbi:hypothetical protein KP509_02G027200 [Ceratopteris richardii]|uniref:Sec16 Sec23-binding domain-containing protein n=1 Tax=Ceratopteris richardii TaxID=49495 RepID=A0A8T2VC77_CERRI|nr:hypothetical protein KP509_02G027200 [Ceratopteris richardii]KAH7443249.1 hypothetical protein KP509_02G027200 [Ceratopteris richardii]
MAAIKSVARSSSVAFGPTEPNVLALATQDGALDASFSASASLELFKIDFASSDPELELLGSYVSSEKFNSIAWGSAGAGSEEQFYGLIATGQSDGTVSLWNPTSLIRQHANKEAALVTKSQKHEGRVRGLEFNLITPNLLASGGDDGEVIIWDIVNPTTPSHFPPLKGSGQDNIVDLSWNRKVQHIMATTSNTGVSMVWDLRRQKSILSFTDPNNRRPCAALEWNPEGATQLIVASADDRSPSLQVWDLRNSISPVKELTGHTKGIVAMAWCPIDSTLLLSSAKDYRTVCWDTSSGEIICELPVSSNWNFDLQWSPRIAGILSTSSYDGRVNLYNIEACSRILPSEGQFGGTAAAGAFSAMKAPKWLKRPVGVTFGFDGKLVSFHTKKGAAVSELNIQSFVSEDELITQSKEFDIAIQDPDNKSSLQALCDKKAQNARSEEEREVWSFLRIMFEEQARTSLLSHLGFTVPQPEENKKEENAEEVLNAETEDKLNISNGSIKDVAEELSFTGAGLDGHEAFDDGADFFNNLSTPKGAVSPQLLQQAQKEAVGDSIMHEAEHQDDSFEEDDCEQAVRRALIVANFKDAVRQCLSENRMADALVLAHVGGAELWEETLAAYFKKHRRPYQRVLAAVAARDIGNLVNSRPLSSWRETLALLCSYAGSQEWTLLCDALAARLDAAGLSQAALLCYICASNIEELARLWYRDVILTCKSTAFAREMQELMEKIVVLALAKGEKRVTPALSRLVGSYAEILLSEGVVDTAVNYLSLVPLEESPEDLIVLRDRIGSLKQEVQRNDYSYGDTAQGVFAPDTTNMPSYGAPSENPLPSYNSQQPQSYGSYYGASRALPDTVQGNQFSHAAPQGAFMAPGMFLPAQEIIDRSQPPSAYPSSFAPSVASFAPVDSPITGGNMPQAPYSSRGPPMQQPSQFLPAATLPTASKPPSRASEWTPDPNAFQKPFQAIPGAQTTTNMMLPGPTSGSMPAPRGFMPVPAPRPLITQQQPSTITPGMQPQSPSSLSSPRVYAASAVPPPPVTIQTADTSNVPADLKPVVATLKQLYNETAEMLGGARAPHAKKREIEDNSKKLGGLFERLNKSDISPNARTKLIQICQCIDAADYTTASQLQVSLTTSDWDECGSWLGPLKRMIKLRQSLR